jgi:hypothetical protein
MLVQTLRYVVASVDAAVLAHVVVAALAPMEVQLFRKKDFAHFAPNSFVHSFVCVTGLNKAQFVPVLAFEKLLLRNMAQAFVSPLLSLRAFVRTGA